MSKLIAAIIYIFGIVITFHKGGFISIFFSIVFPPYSVYNFLEFIFFRFLV